MENQLLKDNIKIEEGNEGVIFNHYSFGELVKHIMVKYGKISYPEADKKLKQHFLFERPKTMDQVVFITHELAYHWAMLIVHGEMYWTKGIPSDFNDFKAEYLSWEAKIKQQYQLKAAYHYYDIED